MSTSGETADLMVREGIQITESALKLAGLGAKNLAALLIALANDNQKVAGKTTLKRLIQDREELTIFSIKEQDLAAFKKESTQYGVLYYPIINKAEKTGTVEIMAKAKDARQINRILERMGIDVPVRQEDEEAKKEPSRVPSGEKSRECGTDTRAAATQSMTNDPKQRLSVRKKVEAIKAQEAQRDKGQPQREKGAPVFHRSRGGKKQKGGLER
ncbi:PcfB family protein [Pseudoflavonifractor capillosus]|uniref:PcfB family protein n=1 Tax=Pseudoflavonifractor capillosus TaxID=106588 RepID=UPI00195DBAF9|nr:PcfB family protein [Pseudoflavonifractor capillosus]MBM6896186.1 PcfB family protein [Pseudoflavonifractor capillosus]